MDELLRNAIDRDDHPCARRLLAAAAAQDRAAVGLGAESTLEALQLAALYDADAALRMLRHGVVCDLHSACALGLADAVARLATPKDCRKKAEELTPMGFALVRGQLAAVQALLAAGDDPERSLRRIGFFSWEMQALAAGHGRWQPLHAAAAHGYAADAAAIVRALVEAGANVEAVCPLGERPLHLAAAYGWLPVLETLLAAGADVDTPTAPAPAAVWRLSAPQGAPLVAQQTPLMVAVREGRLEATAALLDSGAGIVRRDGNGATALHHAARPWWRENAALATRLLAAGADRHARDRDGRTPRDLAVAAGHSDTAALLR